MADDVISVWRGRPPSPVGSKPVEVHVVSTRCVYINDYRIAGGKPYVSENLPSHTLKCTLADCLAAFTDEDILAAIHERQAQAKYFADHRSRALPQEQKD